MGNVRLSTLDLLVTVAGAKCFKKLMSAFFFSLADVSGTKIYFLVSCLKQYVTEKPSKGL